jgi:hypothetical protein
MICASLAGIQLEPNQCYHNGKEKTTQRKVQLWLMSLTGLIHKINSVVRSDRNMRIALTSVLAIHKQRIFNQGFDGRGVKIGTYSTKPTTISKDQQARFTGKTAFRGGYAEYKRAVGKNPGYVILRNTDQMMMDYGLMGQNGNYGFGFTNAVNYQKAQWLQNKYQRDIFDVSKNEEEVLADILVDQLLKGI